MVSFYNHILVSSGFITSKQNPNKVLVVRRKSNPQLIAIPGGKTDPAESSLDTVIREVLEETGVLLEKDKVVPLTVLIECENSKSYWDTVFYAEIDENTPLVTEEAVMDPHWVTFDELISKGAYPEFNKNCLLKLKEARGL